MPFVALLDASVRVDLTDVAPDLWDAIHQVRPRRQLTCRRCGQQMHAKARGGTRFFAHDKKVACPTVGESPEHLRLKGVVAAAVRGAGWRAYVEERVGSRWADVLAVASEGDRRLAFEVQLSPQTAVATAERTADYAAEDVGAVWVVRDENRLGGWSDGPWVRLDDDDAVTGPLARVARVTEDVRVGRSYRSVSGPRWQPSATTVPLSEMLRLLLSEIVVWHLAGFWVPAAEAAAYDRERDEFERQLERLQSEIEQWERNQQRWLERRERVARRAEDALQGAGHGSTVAHLGEVEQRAFAARIDADSGLRVYVCPVASRIGQGKVAAVLNFGDVTVAEDTREVERLRQAGVRNVMTVDEFSNGGIPAPDDVKRTSRRRAVRTARPGAVPLTAVQPSSLEVPTASEPSPLLEATWAVIHAAPPRSSPSYRPTRRTDPEFARTVQLLAMPDAKQIVVTANPERLTSRERAGSILLCVPATNEDAAAAMLAAAGFQASSPSPGRPPPSEENP